MDPVDRDQVKKEVAQQCRPFLIDLMDSFGEVHMQFSLTTEQEAGKSKALASCKWLHQQVEETCEQEGLQMVRYLEYLGVDVGTRRSMARGQAETAS